MPFSLQILFINLVFLTLPITLNYVESDLCNVVSRFFSRTTSYLKFEFGVPDGFGNFGAKSLGLEFLFKN